MAPNSTDKQENTSSTPNGLEKEQTLEGTDERIKAMRHPRWTRQETLILIEAKKVVENQIRGGRRSASALGSDQLEPKWDSVSSYCKQRGVNREPVQCRKRWSNLLCDFKKIKSWELQIKNKSETFWMMRTDLRREKKMPGFFDREVYDVLDGRVFAVTAIPLSFVTVVKDEENEAAAAAAQKLEETGAVFNGAQRSAAQGGLFLDSKPTRSKEMRQNTNEVTAATESPIMTINTPLTISDRPYQPLYQGYYDQGTAKQKHSVSNTRMGFMSQEERKRKHSSIDGYEDSNTEGRLIKVLERNGNLLNSQLESQNMNCQLDRDQRKEQTESLIAALGKITDVLVRIADKL